MANNTGEQEKDRRSSTRHSACIPVQISKGDATPSVALAEELSVVGARILTNARLEVEDQVKVVIFIQNDVDSTTAHGVVRRLERRLVGGPFPDMVAIEFDPPMDQKWEAEIAKLASKQSSKSG
jgi:hypothetical protein